MPTVPDASPFIALGKIERVELLPQLYGRVMVAPQVWEEAVTAGRATGAADAAYLEKAAAELRFVRVRLTPAEKTLAQRLTDRGCGSGEAQVLAVAKGRKALAILDDKAARA
ncbi:MAG: hypothetical protein Q8O76_05530, partial [Chloroflexota bacterium]|nr:hypothetical protein [Chloroflexota bacterium]